MRSPGDFWVEGYEPPADSIDLSVPGDKSISHRALLVAAMLGQGSIEQINNGGAVRALLEPLRSLGCRIDESPSGIELWESVSMQTKTPHLHLGGSSAAARLLIGLLVGCGVEAVVDGSEILRARPMGWLVDPLRIMGAHIDYLGEDGCLPVAVRQASLHPSSVRLSVGSAQARSGVLFAAVASQTPIRIHHPVRSRDHTERLFSYLGVALRETENDVAYEGDPLKPLGRVVIPGDPSLAAYLSGLRLLWGSGPDLRIRDVCLNETRTGFFDVLRGAGAQIEYSDQRTAFGEVVGTVTTRGDVSVVSPIDVLDSFRLHSLIDEVPLLAAVCTQIRGQSRISRAEELAFKETDRLTTTSQMLRAFGGSVRSDESAVTIEGGARLSAGEVPSFGDHRIAMAATVLAAGLPGSSRILQGECADVSFPGFMQSMSLAGARVVGSAGAQEGEDAGHGR